MTPETRAELRRLAEKATPGPWRQHLVDDTTVIVEATGAEICHTTPEEYGKDADVDFNTDVDACEANAALIALCGPETIIQLLDASEPVAGGEFEEVHETAGNALATTLRQLNYGNDQGVTYWIKVAQEGMRRLSVAYARLQAENDAAVERRDKAQDGAVAIQRHRDAWRSYAYGDGDKPQDFLDGNMADRPPTAIERLTAERDAAVAEAGRLREAAAAALVLFIEPGEDTLTRFERIAELYRRDTGRLAPGKDIPMASSDDTPMEERRRLFDEWYNGRIACARAALAGSTS